MATRGHTNFDQLSSAQRTRQQGQRQRVVGRLARGDAEMRKVVCATMMPSRKASRFLEALLQVDAFGCSHGAKLELKLADTHIQALTSAGGSAAFRGRGTCDAESDMASANSWTRAIASHVAQSSGPDGHGCAALSLPAATATSKKWLQLIFERATAHDKTARRTLRQILREKSVRSAWILTIVEKVASGDELARQVLFRCTDINDICRAWLVRIVRKAARDDAAARETLFEFVHKDLAGWLTWQFRQRQIPETELEDARQELALQILSHLGRMRHYNGFLSFVFRTMQTVARTAARQRRRFRSVLDGSGVELRLARQIAVGDPQPCMSSVKQALSELDQLTLVLLVRRYLEDWKIVELAETHELSSHAVETRLKAGIARLRQPMR